MSDTFIFWTHGVNVIPEFTKEYTGHDNGLYMRRGGGGTQIRQRQGTTNWFHFAIPSATKLDDENVDYKHAWLRGTINTHATIKSVHIREGGSSPPIKKWDRLTLTGRTLDESFNLPDKRTKGPLVMDVFVDFNEDGGEVTFTGAGVWFEEHT
jgi:hypothetical protein